MVYEVCILGAGPAGATAALHLARAGHRCLLLDRATFPRDKICGDALSGKVLSEIRQLGGTLPAGLAQAGAGAASGGIVFVAPNGRPLRVPYRLAAAPAAAGPDGYVLPRLAFDNLLLEEVRCQPLIELRENCEVAHAERSALGWQLAGKVGTPVAACRLLLVASGAQSAVARQLAGHALSPRHHSAGLRAYYRGVAGLDAGHFIELHFLPELLPGYLWVFPLATPGEANVGLGMLSQDVSRHRVNLRQRFEQALATHPSLAPRFAHAERLGPVRGWGLPLGSRRQPASGAGYLLLGDAASLIDPFSGEGISNAMLSGRYAAEWAGRALGAQDTSAALLAGYDAALYRRLGEELRLSTMLQQVARWPWLFSFLANRAATNPALAETLSAMFLDVNLRARFRQPGFYLRLLFGGGGATKKPAAPGQA